MSQDFELKFDQMKEGDPTHPQQGAEDGVYRTASNTRNLGFDLAGGRRIFLNYAYLVCCDYQPEQNALDLLFTTHAVKLKGANLGPLYDELMNHVPRIITITDARYNALEKAGKPVVNTISIAER